MKNKGIKKLILGIFCMFFLWGCDQLIDFSPPIVKIVKPKDGEKITGSVEIEIEASDNKGLKKVELYMDKNLVHTLEAEPFVYTWAGVVRKITAKAYDKVGNWSKDEVNIGSEGSAPALLQPNDGAWFWNEGSIEFSWSIFENATNYQLQIDDNSDFSSPEVDETITTASYTWSDLVSGKHCWRVNSQSNVGWGDWSSSRQIEVFPYEVSSWNYFNSGGIYDIHVSGNYAYVTGASDKLDIVDISDPYNPNKIGCYNPVYCYVSGVFVSGSHAYIKTMNNMEIVDVSDPENPTKIGSLGGLASGGDICVSDSFCYVTTASSYPQLKVINVSNPSNPLEMGHCDLPGYGCGICVAGSYAYVACHGSGLRVIDVSNPALPNEVGVYDTPGIAYDVYLLGTYAYIADGSSGLRVLDVSIPTSPNEISFSDTPDDANGIYVVDSYAYVADYSSIRVIDVSDPSSLVEVGSCWDGGDEPAYRVDDIYVVKPFVYVSGGNSLWIVKIPSEITSKKCGVKKGGR